jgi:hypothetical protein
MAVQTNSPSVEVARAHIDAWSNRDWDAARAGLASGVHVVVASTNPELPVTDTVGADEYMTGLQFWVSAITPGSVKELAALGDDNNALVLMTVEADFGFGKVTSPGARMYLFDDDNKIAVEKVLFFLGS